MQKTMGYLVIAIWAAVLLGGAFRPAAMSPNAAPRPDVGYPAPPFTLKNTSGREVSLSGLHGQAVFVNFWASWCGPCRLEMPEIQRLAAELPPQTAILTVNMTAQESSPAAAQAYLTQHGYSFPVLMDPAGEVGNLYRVISLPTSLFISPDGLVTARITGPLSRSAMADYLKAAGR